MHFPSFLQSIDVLHAYPRTLHSDGLRFEIAQLQDQNVTLVRANDSQTTLKQDQLQKVLTICDVDVCVIVSIDYG